SVSGPHLSNGVAVWDYVYFGNYRQINTNNDTIVNLHDDKVPIKWRVLSVEGSEALLLADQNLDSQKYSASGSVSWENSSIRTWLNSTFMEEAFTAKEQESIKQSGVAEDKIYLLSAEEASSAVYGFEETGTASETRTSKNTAYATEYANAITSSAEGYEENGCWWLRSDEAGTVAGFVKEDGSILYQKVNSAGYAVRPALRVALSALKKAGTIDSKGEDLEVEKDGEEIEHLYTDYEYGDAVTGGLELYVGGVSTEQRNYKTAVLYTDILASYRYWENSKGKFQSATGKVIVGISFDAEPEITSGKIVDKDAAKVASASISNGRITVTAKSTPGEVYLVVADTGDKGVMASCPVTVKPAPSTIYTYAAAADEYGDTKYTKADVELGDATTVYLYPWYKDSESQVQKVEDVTFTPSVNSKAENCFTVSPSATDPFAFTITAKGLIDNKKTTGTVTFKCDQNGKKATFSITAVNKVRQITLNASSNLKVASGASVAPADPGNPAGTANTTNAFQISTPTSAKVTGTIGITTQLSSSSYNVTDKPSLYAMGSADGYDATKLAAGTVKITKSPTTAQKKITAAVTSDKKSITITAARGTKQATTEYFLLVYNYNNNQGQGRVGYTVFSVTTE
ncbi:MAG: hypothetical protein IJ733_07335, partial [Lachnospiraceae bacterium]|nr:hypothetical protein [Lachnospiraceae bacterium]